MSTLHKFFAGVLFLKMVFFFLLLSKGWCVIYTSLLFSEWVRYYILGILVYCSDGFMLIFNMETSASLFYHMMCLGIFLLLFIDMIASDSCWILLS